MEKAVAEARRRGEEEVGKAGPSDKSRRREKEKQLERSEDVFVREDSIQTTPTKPFTTMAAPPQPRGLGIDILPESSLNAQLETPTQPAAPMRRRKKASASEDQNEPVPTSFASTLPTPTPGLQRPLIHSNPSTPRLGRPEAKRRRVTPDSESTDHIPQLPEPVHMIQETKTADAPWSSWQERSPFSSPEDQHVRAKRRKFERERIDIVGGKLELYNAGLFGPRLGVGRL
jgi:hypothetical protein